MEPNDAHRALEATCRTVRHGRLNRHAFGSTAKLRLLRNWRLAMSDQHEIVSGEQVLPARRSLKHFNFQFAPGMAPVRPLGHR